jgi:alkylhydroperoxidase/carboxymuconolactone decarboxylase family protein YurZ
MAEDQLPPIVEQFAKRFPQTWQAYERLGQAAAQAGPVSGKSERLVKLGVAVGARLEGAVRSHVRRALAAGITREEVEHVALLAITTVGWPTALAAYSWMVDEMGTGKKAVASKNLPRAKRRRIHL